MELQPQEKTNELIERLNAALHWDIKDELRLKRFENEIKNEITQLIAVNPAAGYSCRGMLCSLKKDMNGIIKNHELALSLGYNGFLAHRNYAASLLNVGRVFDGLEYAQRACAIEKKASILKLLVYLCVRTARFKESITYCQELEKMNPSTHEELGTVPKIVEFMNRHNLTDDDVSQFVKLAYVIAEKNQLEIQDSETQLFPDYDGDGECLSISLRINTQPEHTACLSWDFAEAIVETVPDTNLLCKISCGFKTARLDA
jgi:tetratricopeptide (TPR) repeat protein